jgi:hypothetical protein
VSIRLHVAEGCDARDVTRRTVDAICRQLPVHSIRVHTIGGGDAAGSKP